MSQIVLPKILDIPPKLLPIIFNLNNYHIFLIDGGRGGAKSQSIARILLWIAEQRKVRVCCGREIQNTISDSVKTLLDDRIDEFNLNFTSKKDCIIHNTTNSSFIFKGLREQGKINIKGIEGVDILWIDEAQAITKPTLDVIIPTIRKNNSILFFTMNRLFRNDPVYVQCIDDKDCMHITINYDENPFCPEVLINEAEKCKAKNISDYLHIWKGLPMDKSKNALFAISKLDEAKNLTPYSDSENNLFSVLSVDIAGSGADMNVAKFIKQVNRTTWQDVFTVDWSEPDTDVTIGKIINLSKTYNPFIISIDGDGVGYAVAVAVKNATDKVVVFRGAGKVKNPRCNAANQRAEGYLDLKDFIDNNFLKITHQKTLTQLEYLKAETKRDGKVYIQSKDEIREEQGESPDYADALMMGIYAINHYSYMFSSHKNEKDTFVNTDFDPFN